MQIRFVLYLGPLVFTFNGDDDLLDWLGALFAHARTPRELYELLVLSTADMLMTATLAGEEFDDRLAPLLGALRRLTAKYGSIYDPARELFLIEETARHQ